MIYVYFWWAILIKVTLLPTQIWREKVNEKLISSHSPIISKLPKLIAVLLWLRWYNLYVIGLNMDTQRKILTWQGQKKRPLMQS